jgi:hypothetical protein
MLLSLSAFKGVEMNISVGVDSCKEHLREKEAELMKSNRT